MSKPVNENGQYAFGIPEHVLRSCIEKFVDDVKHHVRIYVMSTKVTSSAERNRAFTQANSVLEDLEEETYDVLESNMAKLSRLV